MTDRRRRGAIGRGAVVTRLSPARGRVGAAARYVADVRTSIGRGIAWTGVAGVVLGVLDVAATLLLLRCWLTPAEYGVAALVTPLFPMFDLMADAGFAAAVVQADDAEPDAVSAAFWASCGASLVVALALFAVGPALAAAHGQPVLALLVPAYGAKLAVWNLVAIPSAVLRRELRFGAVAKIRTAAALAEFAGKVLAAAAGLGVWCFVIGQLAKAGMAAVATLATSGFRPRWRCDRRAVARYWRFGRRTSASQVLFHLYTNADYQIVGLWFGAAATGLYRAAYELVLEPTKLLSYVVVEVAFPVFARLRHDLVALRARLIEFTRSNLLVLVPVLTALVLVPGDWLAVFYGERWRAGAHAVRLLCAVGALRALAFLLPPLLDGVGRAELTLRYTLIAAVLVPASQLAAAVALGPSLGWTAVAWAWVAGYPLAFAVLLALALGQIELAPRRYLAAVAPFLGVGVVGLAAGAATAAAAGGLPALARVAAVSAAVVVSDGAAWLLVRRARPRW